jgi:hypothetical protein
VALTESGQAHRRSRSGTRPQSTLQCPHCRHCSGRFPLRCKRWSHCTAQLSCTQLHRHLASHFSCHARLVTGLSNPSTHQPALRCSPISGNLPGLTLKRALLRGILESSHGSCHEAARLLLSYIHSCTQLPWRSCTCFYRCCLSRPCLRTPISWNNYWSNSIYDCQGDPVF